MTNRTLLSRFSLVLAAGGLAWLAKIAVIAASDGAETGAASALTGVFYLSGVALMATGLGGIAVALAAGRHLALRALAGLAGAISFFVAYVALESVAQAVAGDAGPTWFADEVGILVTGAVLAALGLYAARTGDGISRAAAA